MKKQIFNVIRVGMVVAVCLVLTSCNVIFSVRERGPLTTEDYTYTNFRALDIGSAFEVEIEYADTYSMQITAHENVLKNVKITRIGETLKIGMQWPWFSIGSRNLKAKITMPELTKLTLSGSSEGTVKGFKSSQDFETDVSGASDLNLDMETGAFTGEISGSSELTAYLKSSSTKIGLSGASDLKINVVTGRLEITSSGSSETKGYAEATSSTFHLSGASDMTLTGKGGNIDLFGSGASSFRLMEYAIDDVNIGLSGASDADMVISGTLQGNLSGSSELRYEGTPVIGKDFDISGDSTFKRR
jgi:hypothetical protein